MEALSSGDRRRLLIAAREAIACALAGRSALQSDPTPALGKKRGAFVTLSERGSGELRGCIGYVEPRWPMLETVTRAAVAAALHDRRFAPVTARELPNLAIEISVLSPPQPIRPEEIVIGGHGLIVSLGRCRGLLLPQVASEHGWDVPVFLAQTCCKAGLAPDSWRQPGAELLGFTAAVFGDETSEG